MESIAEYFTIAYNVLTHIDMYLGLLSQFLGVWLYVIVFAIIFCETGLVITPFLPGDSLIFALGALCAAPSMPNAGVEPTLNFTYLFFTILVAGILGDATNYAIGNFVGPKIFRHKPKNRFLAMLFKQEYLIKTQNFYLKHGGKTIVWARFIPIIRTFAPFVAGIGKMNYKNFAIYNFLGALLWVGSLLTLGKIFGNLPTVKDNFHYVLVIIVFISLLPPIIEWILHKRKNRLPRITNN